MASAPSSSFPNGTTNGSSPPSADGQKQKRARTSKPKVKTGCNNCKQRRIKCDEQRPECYNCVRSKKVCSGYPPPPRSARPFEEVRIAPKPVPIASAPPPGRQAITLPPRRALKVQRRASPPITPTTTIQAVPRLLHVLSTNLPLTAEEGQYFQLFREQTANDLSGFFDLGFWAHSVPRECHAAAAIRHAVIALGALYKTLDKSNESPPSSPSSSLNRYDSAVKHWEVAFRQYSNACTSLLRADTAATTSNRTRLMASVLLACFDSFVGHHKQAIKQIQTGLALLDKLRTERRRAFSPSPDDTVEDELTQMFTRLAIQAKSYDMAFHFPHPWVVSLTGQNNQGPSSPASEAGSPPPMSINQDPIPERFSSAKEARLAWDKLIEGIFRLHETLFAQAQNGVMGVLPADLLQLGLGYAKELDDWSSAYEHILASRTAPGISSQEKAAIVVLKMNQVMTRVLFLMTYRDSEMHFDRFTPEFKHLVELALEVVGDEERRAAARRCPDPATCRHQDRCEPDIFGGTAYATRHIKPSFSADLGIVPPLYVVATKCRVPHIRRQAIQLLRSSARREGMWDSELTARIGMWITDVEEAELYSNDFFMPSPEASPIDAYSYRSASRSVTPPSATFSTNGRLSVSPPPNFEFGDVSFSSGGVNSIRESLSPGFPVTKPQPKAVPAEKRVMVRAVEFDLRERSAIIQIGSRDLKVGMPDLKTKVKEIRW
ncbi:hypothetical protein QBC38DRAFT_454450 [Podospora fimiseda]|uniref:Zn(2)-C6 fungal-type domain-containing protein n=1 Tax=Podospora fimiseda TaxID=252190 RepID=A0AAN7BRM8_9PEZI|nr:hypothetical protein QBC38DRAFT_454450 [Podospora fimiseda]